MEDFIEGIHFTLSGGPEERVKAFLEAYKPTDGNFDTPIMTRLCVVSATAKPKCTATFELTVVRELCNKRGPMHGGATATAFDMCTTMASAPIAEAGFWQFGGLSRNLNVTYLKPAMEGDVVTIDCVVVQIGRNLATIRGEMTRKKDGVLLAMAEHTKVAVKSKVGPEQKL